MIIVHCNPHVFIDQLLLLFKRTSQTRMDNLVCQYFLPTVKYAFDISDRYPIC